jgi:electron transport complex protein RnfE
MEMEHSTMMKNKKLKLNDLVTPFTNGIIKNNVTFRLVLGTCPTLAVTTLAMNGIGMGLAVTFVLVFSNAIVSALRNFIPRKVRIPAYILIIATFSTIVEMVTRAFLPDLYSKLGLFIPLIVVNCILLARVESFASLNRVLPSVMDGLGIGLGFTMSITLMGIIREFIGAGTFFGMPINALINADLPMVIFILPAGGFMVFGFMLVIFNTIVEKIENLRGRSK